MSENTPACVDPSSTYVCMDTCADICPIWKDCETQEGRRTGFIEFAKAIHPERVCMDNVVKFERRNTPRVVW